MPRGRSAPRSRSSPPPQTVNNAPPPATVQTSGGGSLFGSIGSSIADGFAFSTGSSIARRAVDAVMGPMTIRHETVVSEAEVEAVSASPVLNSMSSSGSCDIQSKAFQDCVNNFGSDISKCQFYMDMLSECRKNSGSMMDA